MSTGITDLWDASQGVTSRSSTTTFCSQSPQSFPLETQEERDKSDGEDDVMVCKNDLGRWDGVVLNQNSKSSRSRRNSYLNRGAKGDSNSREQHGLLEAYG